MEGLYDGLVGDIAAFQDDPSRERADLRKAEFREIAEDVERNAKGFL